MMKAILFTLILTSSSLINADETSSTIQPPPTNAGNTTCPVSGKPINGKDTYVHNGTEYNLCSEGCKSKLAENPESHLDCKPEN